MFRNLTLIALLLALTSSLLASAATLDVRGEDDRFLDDGPVWADNDPVRVKIDPTLQNATVNQTFTWRAYTLNLAYEPEQATNLGAGEYADGTARAQAGHTHYYATYLGDNNLDPSSPDFWNYTNVFGGADPSALIEPGVLEFTTTLPADGLWQLFLVAQYDDHTPRIPGHPQQWTAQDTVLLNVVPEPNAAAMLAVGLFWFWLVARPKRSARAVIG